MKNAILVPTDFSKNALSAARYAAFMASEYTCELELLHVYTANTRALAGPAFNEQLEQHAAERAEIWLQDLQNQLTTDFPMVHISYASMQGDLTTIVLNLIKAGNIRFVVVGTKGATGFKGAALGSNTFDLIQHSPIGVLAVPLDYTPRKINHVGLLTNFKEIEFTLLNAFVNRTTTALSVSLLHVSEPRQIPSEADTAFWIDMLQKNCKVETVFFRAVEAINRLDNRESIPNSVRQMTEDADVDVLLMSYNRKSFFRQLFSKSLTKSIAQNLTVPTYFRREIG